ncbi:MAG: 50S ribosomal protein L33 [Nanoarchaeota archaeon]
MSQDNLKKLQCTECKHINYFTTRKKKEGGKKLALKKYCKFCKKHAPHKEMKK